ncbi:MAG: AAA family ATPase, partial [Acidimicrobiia bacterium]|nr:AAA family ATPase [Acidimicrobiia bacterium]
MGPTPALIGRDGQVALVGECLDAVGAGHARAVLCVGEPGIGKTRLAQEAGSSARQRNFAVAWGIADDLVGTPPYWPWQQMFRSLAHDGRIAAVADELGLTGHLGRLLSQTAPPQPDDSTYVTSPDARFRLFDSATTVLRAASRRQPLALVLDDAHWADEASLLLLRHLVGALADDAILVWVNTRQIDVAVEQWDRASCVRRVDLAGLDDTAVRRQLEALIGDEVTDAEAAGVHSLTGGNPFFVAEAARTLVERRIGRRGETTSTGTRHAVAARVARLPAGSQDAVRAAAVVGREFDLRLLAAVIEASEIDTLASLAAAEQQALVEPAFTGGSVYRFVHAIVRDAIEDGL